MYFVCLNFVLQRSSQSFFNDEIFPIYDSVLLNAFIIGIKQNCGNTLIEHTPTRILHLFLLHVLLLLPVVLHVYSLCTVENKNDNYCCIFKTSLPRFAVFLKVHFLKRLNRQKHLFTRLRNHTICKMLNCLKIINESYSCHVILMIRN